MANRLAHETSPYLRQHADNPVDWYPWGPEALARAEREDRPILLSVGYSSCHWCHVMERESFEDPSIAGLMNERFVNIKVDREERPDIDQIYMKAVQAMSGRGGWPMTVFLTPSLVPFFGGTYYPPEPRPGIPSFPQILDAISEAWRERREDVVSGGERLLDALDRAQAAGGRESEAGPELLDGAYRTLATQYDSRHGGFGTAPKFPQPVTLELLMRHHVRTGDSSALEMAVHTLRRMAAGGMRDHLAGGFHRYSVDARWLVPHFEKMLYDNALLGRAYLDAYRLTDSDDLLDVATHTLDYVADDLRAPEGGFYAARDADSEGVEGRYYVWTPEEVEEVLEPEEVRLFARAYDVSAGGNFEGVNVLHLPHELSAIASSEGMQLGELEARLERAKAALLRRRVSRPAPFRDEKVIVAWNGLAIRAFAEAGATLGRSDYVSIAEEASSFLLRELRPEGRLLHSWIDGSAAIPAFLDDVASLGNALLSLHGATLKRRWLDVALELCDEILERFYDPEVGTVFDTAHDAEALVLRPRDPMDNATPSGPSLAAELLARAAGIVDRSDFRSVAREIVDHEADALGRYGPAFARMLSVLDRLEAPSVEIALVRLDDEVPVELIAAAHGRFLSNAVIAGRCASDPSEGIALLEGRSLLEGGPAAYVCRDRTCHLPVSDPAGVRARLAEIAGSD